MDSTFIAACQGAGLALAAGVLAGAPGRSGAAGSVLQLAAAIVGGVLFGISLSDNGHTAWPGYIAGAVLALFAFLVARDIAASAAARGGAGAGAISVYIAAFAVVLAGLSLVVPPISIVAFVALVALALARRRRATRKYEGLRVLR